MGSDIDFFFNPKSVAVVGASNVRGKIGFNLVEGLLESGFRGSIFPVNPKGGEVLGLRMYDSVLSLPSTPDLAVIATPARVVSSVIRECGLKGIRGAVVISAGFSEAGNKSLEEDLLRTARKYGVRIIGPNSAGIINTEVHFHACLEFHVPPGPVSLISQSGAVGGVLFALAREAHIGFNKFVSCGNACDVNEIDVLEYLLSDESTKSIAFYMETLHGGKRFLEVVGRNVGKPVVVLKGGKGSAGARAAASHTGALASPYSIYSAVFRQTHVFEVSTISSLFFASKASALLPPVSGGRVAIVTNSGGPGVVATDLCEFFGMVVPEPSAELKERLRRFLPSICSLRNPLDLTAMAEYDWYYNTLRELILSGEFDLVLVICVPPSFIDPRAVAKAVVDLSSLGSGVPLLSCFLYGDVVRESVKYLEEHNIPCASSVRDAVLGLKALTYFGSVGG